MLYLTDHPETTACFLPDGAEWRRGNRATLAESDQPLSDVFGIGEIVWTCEVPVTAGVPHPERRMVLIDHASASQFDAAMAALNGSVDLPDGLVCLALEGARHRGQRQRAWKALRGNLHLTAHYHVGMDAARMAAGLTMLPVVAAARAVEDVTEWRIQPRIKWVNDLLVDGRKVAGVLTATHMRGQTVERAVFGIGINVARAPDLEPSPFVTPAGALTGGAVSLPDALDAVLRRLDEGVDMVRLGALGALFEAYTERADFVGRTVRIWPEDGESNTPLCEGPVRRLFPNLSLELEGCKEPVRTGRMTYEGAGFRESNLHRNRLGAHKFCFKFGVAIFKEHLKDFLKVCV